MNEVDRLIYYDESCWGYSDNECRADFVTIDLIRKNIEVPSLKSNLFPGLYKPRKIIQWELLSQSSVAAPELINKKMIDLDNFELYFDMKKSRLVRARHYTLVNLFSDMGGFFASSLGSALVVYALFFAHHHHDVAMREYSKPNHQEI